MELSLDAYNFLAEKNNWTKVSNLEELDNGCKEHYIRKNGIMINISDYSLMSTLYLWSTNWNNDDVNSFLGMIKVIDGEVTEYYTRPPKIYNNMGGWVSRDLYTNKMLEYYLYNFQDNKLQELKYDMEGELLQTNYMISKFDELPEEYQNALIDYPDKDKIYGYANKPYGKIVEVNCLKNEK